MNLTKIIRPFFVNRLRQSDAATEDTEEAQRRQLAMLVKTAAGTEWGQRHSYSRIAGYDDYRRAVELTPYEKLRPQVMRIIEGERNVLWPGLTRRFAQSSGTSDGKSKYIPVTDDSLRLNHYRGGADVVARYMTLYPDSRIFSGRSFILGGSFANGLNLPSGSGVKVGDLSANLIEAINPLANLFRIPDKKTALMPDWHLKLPALVKAAARHDVTNISGVPSWFLTVLNELLRYTGAEEIHQVWPNLEVFFHGGISFLPYRLQYDRIIDPTKMRYLETYNASEGFFAIQDSRDSRAMRLITDGGVFYEFIPVDNPEAGPVAAWEVEQGKIYESVISSCNGLWRYPTGDTLKIESTAPLRVTIFGRTKHYINAFGEEVMVHNTDAALATACEQCGCAVRNYTVAPVFAADGRKGYHQWLIEYSRCPADSEAFANALDKALTAENSDYEAKRAGNIFLGRLRITEAREGLFDAWLESTGKLGGQRKVPRLSNDRKVMDAMLRFNDN